MVLEDSLAAFVASHVRDFLVRGQKVRELSKREVGARRISLADVAVDTAPAILAGALLAVFALSSLFTIRERVTFFTTSARVQGDMNITYEGSDSRYLPILVGTCTARRSLNTLQNVRTRTQAVYS